MPGNGIALFFFLFVTFYTVSCQRFSIFRLPDDLPTEIFADKANNAIREELKPQVVKDLAAGHRTFIVNEDAQPHPMLNTEDRHHDGPVAWLWHVMTDTLYGIFSGTYDWVSSFFR